MDMEEHKSIWKSEEEESMVSVTVGRVMTTLLTARPTKLIDSISHLQSSPNPHNLLALSLENSLRILHKYVKDGAEKEEPLDAILIPMIEHSLRCKESKYKNQEMIILNWLFQDEVLFQALARNFSDIVLRKEDRHIALGWCILARHLIEYDVTMGRFSTTGIKERYTGLLENLSICSTHLLSLISNGSTLQGGFELPTRLSVAAADCVIALSIALTRKEMVSEASENTKKSSKPSRQDLQGISVVAVGGQRKAKSISPASEVTRDMKMSLLLWNLLDRLIMLVQRLHAVLSSLLFLHEFMNFLTPAILIVLWKTGPPKVKTGMLLLSSCWKHYGILLHLENHRISDRHNELLDQYLAGIERLGGLVAIIKYHIIIYIFFDGVCFFDKRVMQYYAGNSTTEHRDDKDSGIATINFFLNCLLLLLGCFTSKQFDTAMREHRLHITRVVASQVGELVATNFFRTTVDMTWLAFAHVYYAEYLLKKKASYTGKSLSDDDVIDGAVSILKATIFGTNHLASGCSLVDSKQMHSVLPLLLNLLDERDGTARAVVTLIAEFCSMSADRYCLEEILNRLAGENIAQRRNAFDVLSEVIHISSDSASTLSHSLWQEIANHLLDILKDEDDIIRAHATKLLTLIDPSLVLPGLVHLIYSSDATLHSSAASTLLGVLTYHNQKPEIVSMVLDCLSNPNASSDFQKATTNYRLEGFQGDADRVLKLIPEWSRSVKNWKLLAGPLVDKMFADPSNPIIVKFLSYISDHLAGVADVVFQRILLHTESQTEIDESFLSELDTSYAENDVKLQHSLFDRLCPLLIIRLLPLRVFNDLKSSVVYGNFGRNSDKNEISGSQCIADLLLKRAFNKLEFEDVRKLSAELCGRIHPNVLIPAVSSELETATNDHDILKIKACLFSICTSLVVELISIVTFISKAQHGCIDCLAIMVCIELQNSEPSRNSTLKETNIVRNGKSNTSRFHAYVLDRLTGDEHKLLSSNPGSDNHMSSKQFLSFRLCMANVLISACQKIADSGKKPFALKTLQRITHSVRNVKEPEIRAACIQERMGGAKLLASLLASEEAVVQSISEGLLEARTLLSTISLTDSSSTVRQLCTQLLACMTSP
ncbi:Armadillo-like helical [Cynara cardunculus var. scolymus]|uniref:Armadillo-like helical n=1 Tax=Cynara cardunculus var. scolymus TaxID=59895 RepID=A0A103YLJ6_CYNCS|nr:Armadillo-like helical [Cynara cardunculus var. scolymus]